jgi:hypothetical protein
MSWMKPRAWQMGTPRGQLLDQDSLAACRWANLATIKSSVSSIWPGYTAEVYYQMRQP